MGSMELFRATIRALFSSREVEPLPSALGSIDSFPHPRSDIQTMEAGYLNLFYIHGKKYERGIVPKFVGSKLSRHLSRRFLKLYTSTQIFNTLWPIIAVYCKTNYNSFFSSRSLYFLARYIATHFQVMHEQK